VASFLASSNDFAIALADSALICTVANFVGGPAGAAQQQEKMDGFVVSRFLLGKPLKGPQESDKRGRVPFAC